MKSLFKKITAKRQSVTATAGVDPTDSTPQSLGVKQAIKKTSEISFTEAPAEKKPLDTVPEKYRGTTLTEEQKSLVTASVPALQVHGFDITKLFYTNLIEKYPVVKNVFNHANQETLEQPKALAGAVLAYAENINDLTPLLPAVELIANKHASLYVAPELYAVVGTELMTAIAGVLGDAVTPELGEAWTAAYWQLAEIFIRREDAIYKASGGWTDWKDFKIAKKVKESDEISSFYLEPVDASMKPLPTYKPGQYISIQTDVPSLGFMQTRQYSLSQPTDPNYLRISIKKEMGGKCPGLVSNLMHDTKFEGDIVKVSHPAGDFFTDLSPRGPIVFISAGVGLTPLNAMLASLVDKTDKPITWIHGAKCPGARAFATSIEAIKKDNFTMVFFDNADPAPSHMEGRVDLSRIDKEKTLFIGDEAALYYVCGPVPFMQGMSKTLEEIGIAKDRILMERFSVGGVPSP